MTDTEPNKRSKWKLILGCLVGVPVLLLLVLKLVYGRGTLYEAPKATQWEQKRQVKVLVELPLPPGMVVTSATGRIFFTYHPFGEPMRFAKGVLFELVKGKKVPYPSVALQHQLEGAMGITVDKQDRLWLVIPGQMKGKHTRVVGIDLKTNAIAKTYTLPKGVGGLAQDLRVSRDGQVIYLADTGLMRFTSGYVVVLNLKDGKTRSLFKGHPSMKAQGWYTRTKRGTHSLGFGLITFAVGLDGIALTHDDKWLYLASMTHDSMYRIETKYVRNAKLPVKELYKKLQFVSKKPLSDGIDTDPKGNVYITDVEYGRGLSLLTPKGELKTIFHDKRMIWADCVHVAKDGTIYVTDSGIPSYLGAFMQPPSKKTLDAAGPYRIFMLPPVKQ